MAKAEQIVGVECEGLVTDAVSLVLTPRLTEMCLLRKAALDFRDPEGVHDMRVASRRLRSALRDFAPHLRKTKMAPATKHLREIADALGVVRDHDVAIIGLEKLQKKAKPEILAGLQKIIEDQKAKLDIERKELQKALDYKMILELKRNFRNGLKDSTAPRITKTPPAAGATVLTASASEPTAHKSGPSYKAYARGVLLKRLRELDTLSPSLYEPQRIKPLHEMRIAAKRLRYAMELFAACWGDQLGAFSQQVAQMQSSLGELHDCDLWIGHFGKRLSRLKKKSKSEQTTSPDERDAMVWLLSHFSRLRTKHFRAALGRWNEWEEKDFCNRLISTLRT
jgi:CHAD domain-containing protein